MSAASTRAFCAASSFSDGATPSATFCHRSRWAKTLLSWKIMLTGRWSGGSAVTSCPAISTRPCSGASKPAIKLSSVDLPPPEGPITAVKDAFGNSASKRIVMSS